MEPQSGALAMQEEMIREIEQAQPKYLVSVGIRYSWLANDRSEERIFNWAKDYLGENYDLVGLVNIASADRTDYYFDEVPTSTSKLSQNTIGVYRRKS